MPNPENLEGKGFKKGQSGNPAGKKPGTLSFKTIINKWLNAKMDEPNPETGEVEKMTLGDIITIRQIQKAKKGDTRAYEVLKDHVEAKPKQGIDLTSAGESLAGKEIVFKRYAGKKDDETK